MPSRGHSARSCWSHARPGSPGRCLVREAEKQWGGWSGQGGDGWAKQHAGGAHALSGIPPRVEGYMGSFCSQGHRGCYQVSTFSFS